MVSFKINYYGVCLLVCDVRVVCSKSVSASSKYYYSLEALTRGSVSAIFLDFGRVFYNLDEAFEILECIENKYPYLFENRKNIDHICDVDFYPEFSVEAVKER